MNFVLFSFQLHVQLSKASPRSIGRQSQSEMEAAVLRQNEQMLKANIEQLNKDISDNSTNFNTDETVLDSDFLNQKLPLYSSQSSNCELVMGVPSSGPSVHYHIPLPPIDGI